MASSKNGAPGLLHGIPINVRRKNTESESSTLGKGSFQKLSAKNIWNFPYVQEINFQ